MRKQGECGKANSIKASDLYFFLKKIGYNVFHLIVEKNFNTYGFCLFSVKIS